MRDSQSAVLGPQDLGNLSAVKLQLVPAQGPNTLIIPALIIHKYYFGTVPYTVPQPSPQPLFNYYLGDQVCLYPDGGLPPRLLGYSENRFFTFSPVSSDINGLITANAVNQPLMMGNDGTVDVFGGDGKLEVEVIYYVANVSSSSS